MNWCLGQCLDSIIGNIVSRCVVGLYNMSNNNPRKRHAINQSGICVLTYFKIGKYAMNQWKYSSKDILFRDLMVKKLEIFGEKNEFVA